MIQLAVIAGKKQNISKALTQLAAGWLIFGSTMVSALQSR